MFLNELFKCFDVINSFFVYYQLHLITRLCVSEFEVFAS